MYNWVKKKFGISDAKQEEPSSTVDVDKPGFYTAIANSALHRLDELRKAEEENKQPRKASKKIPTILKIEDTLLYKNVMDVVRIEHVLKYRLKYRAKDSSTSFVVEGCGIDQGNSRDEIAWDKIKDSINLINADANARLEHHSTLRINDVFHVDANEFNNENKIFSLQFGEWSGAILLKNGNWIEISTEHDGYNDEYYTSVVMHKKPIFGTLSKDYECTIKIDDQNQD